MLLSCPGRERSHCAVTGVGTCPVGETSGDTRSPSKEIATSGKTPSTATDVWPRRGRALKSESPPPSGCKTVRHRCNLPFLNLFWISAMVLESSVATEAGSAQAQGLQECQNPQRPVSTVDRSAKTALPWSASACESWRPISSAVPSSPSCTWAHTCGSCSVTSRHKCLLSQLS